MTSTHGAAPTMGPAAGPCDDDRATLRREKAQLLHWRRLVRSRLDLAVAALAPPPLLGEMGWHLAPVPQLCLPLPRELTDAITVTSTEDPVALLRRLRSLDAELAAYGVELDDALERCAPPGGRGRAGSEHAGAPAPR